MIKHISSPAISEEILGAYLEGNLSEFETQQVEDVLECDDDLDGLVDEIAVEELSMLDTDADTSPSVYDENPNFDFNFELPEVEPLFDRVSCFIGPRASASPCREEMEVSSCACYDWAIEESWDDIIEKNADEESVGDDGLGSSK